MLETIANNSILMILLFVFGASAAISFLGTLVPYVSALIGSGGSGGTKEKEPKDKEGFLKNSEFYAGKNAFLRDARVFFCKRELFFAILTAAGTISFVIGLFAKGEAIENSFFVSLILIAIPVLRYYFVISKNGGFKHLNESLKKSAMQYYPTTATTYDVYNEYEDGSKEYVTTETHYDSHVGENLIVLFFNLVLKVFKFFWIFGAAYGMGFFFVLLSIHYYLFGSFKVSRYKKKAGKWFRLYVTELAKDPIGVIQLPFYEDPKVDKVPQKVIKDLAKETRICELEKRTPAVLCIQIETSTYFVASGVKYLFSFENEGMQFRVYENEYGLSASCPYDKNTSSGIMVPLWAEEETGDPEKIGVSDAYRAFFTIVQFRFLQYKKAHESGSCVVRVYDYDQMKLLEAPLSDFVLDEEKQTYSLA